MHLALKSFVSHAGHVASQTTKINNNLKQKCPTKTKYTYPYKSDSILYGKVEAAYNAVKTLDHKIGVREEEDLVFFDIWSCPYI